MEGNPRIKSKLIIKWNKKKTLPIVRSLYDGEG